MSTIGSLLYFQEVKQTTTSEQLSGKNLVDLEEMDEKAVTYELFHSIVREVRDEVGLINSSPFVPILS